MDKQEELTSKPHIMAISFPLQGHMNPVVQFSKRLVSRGIRLTIVTTTTINMHTQLANSINIEHISTDPSEGETPNTIDDYIALFKLSVSKSLPDIITKQKTNGHPIKVLVYDSLMPWALDIAHKFGIQGVSFFTQSCAICAIFYNIHRGTLRIPYDEGSNYVSLPSMPLLEIKDLPSFVYDIGPYQGLLSLSVDQFSNMKKANCVLFNTFDELESEIAKWLSSQWPIKTIGPSIPSMFLDKRLPDDRDYGLSLFKPDAEACIKWLNAKATGSVVYVSFGSIANLGQDHMDEVAWGLLNSSSNFLWVVRETEQNKLPGNFKAEASEKGLVVSWCPQLEVLAHKAVGSFMTHCGWNSTLEALSLGVPMLVMPQWTDQTTNAKYVVDVWRTGVWVKARDKEIFTREDIANCIKDVMDGAKGEELRANAIKWKELAVEAMSEGGSSDKNIDEFISKSTKSKMAKKSHILVIPYPQQGHINPMLQFSKRLASRGLRVTLVTTIAHKTLIQNQPTSPINFEHISDGFNEGQKPDSIELFVQGLKAEWSKSLPKIIEKLKNSGYPVNAVVYDSFTPWILDIAKEIGLYGVCFFTHSCAVSAIYYHTRKGSVKIPVEKGSLICLPAIPDLGIGDLPSFVSDVDSYPAVLRLVLDRFSNFQEADCLFFNTFDKLEDEIAKWLSSQWPIKTIGPSIPSMFLDKRLPDDKDYGLSLFKPDAEACIKWLNAKDTGSVVYVSFGSIANLGQDHMDEVAWGLLNSNSNFLWVVRETEQSKLPSDFMAKAKGKGLVVSWCPQLEVLAHNAVGSFMTHCGWNSTLEALSLGVPMLVMPQWADQSTNAKYVVDVWQTGVRVKDRDKEIFTREDIANRIKDVMDGAKGEELRANAIKGKELAVEAMSEGGSSDKNIDEFISKVISTTT
uniref:UGT41 n=1 Tax=Panax notoginseng TaxID=44586 RepID=A0A977R8Y6_9APIA|nr:UGT41 [Panax notoginseng]